MKPDAGRPVPAATLIFTLLLAGSAGADRGMMPLEPAVKIYEPLQDAAVAWNGKEEILLLATDLRASEPTKVLEVLPLPSEPKVSKGSDYFFVVAQHIIDKHLFKPKKKNGGKDRSASEDAALPAGTVTFHAVIGAHDVSVTKVLDAAGFVKWVTKYLKGQGEEVPEITEAMKETVTAYLKNDCKWFVFDVVSLGKDTKRHDALAYRFKTKHLYYPLRVMGSLEGKTEVNLLVFSNKGLAGFKGIAKSRVTVDVKPFKVKGLDFMNAAIKIFGPAGSYYKKPDETLWEMAPGAGQAGSGYQPKYDPDAFKAMKKNIQEVFGLFGGPGKNVKLRLWRIEGEASSFTKDLIVK